MFELKPLSPDAIPAALAKAERYRLLNESWQAESICLDILAVDPNHQEALVTLLLALTDQFHDAVPNIASRARELLTKFDDEYRRAYYEGIIFERRAKAMLDQHAPGSGPMIYDWLRQAMQCYERAAAVRPAGNDDALLRWNTCVRVLRQRPHLAPRDEAYEPQLLE
ncbi:MAG: hypothetical protein DMF86_20250 [Acidobacteria bacterium]|nr:MAG: hypothetical protein DMF86_20250 [Acidobacteriota bacterium]